MPLFRFHRGGLEESLKTTVIVRSISELKNIIHDNWSAWNECDQIKNLHDFDIKIFIPYELDLEK